MAPAVSPQQWAHRGGRHTGRLKRSSGLETVRGHHLGSLACKPLAGSPTLLSGCRTAPRSTTSATDRSRPCCAAWYSSTPPPSSKRPNRQPAPACCRFVKDEFDAFLEYGILAHGFLRLHCGDCGHDKMVAVSCKRRGFCPSCGARRAANGADDGAPGRPRHSARAVRQWVLSLPIPLRLLLAAQPEPVTPLLQVVHRLITRHLLGQAGLKAEEADSGGHADPTLWFGRQSQHPPSLPSAGRRVPV